jgi:transposase
MARPVNPLAQFTVKTHVSNGYTYATTQPPSIDAESGKKVYKRILWGSVDDNLKFTPGVPFYLASPEERAKLIFPENWDMSEATKLTGLRGPGRPSCEADCQNRLYGDIWLLEQIAEKTGIRHDLEVVFDRNYELVDDILTLAMFPYITKFNYNRVARWQNNNKAPSSRILTPSMITRLTQSITEQHRLDLLKLRALKINKDELCAVDSTTRSAYGDSLADIRWGKNKEHLPLAQTTEVVVYTLSSHMPLYYRTFPGNMPDSRSLTIILKDLEHANFKNIVLITDRGYESLYNLEQFILRGQSMIMCTKTSQKEVMKAIDNLGEFGTRPESMKADRKGMVYYEQFNIEYEIEHKGNNKRKTYNLKLNLYFDSVRRSNELFSLDIDIEDQKISLEEMVINKTPLPDDTIIKNNFNYFKVKYDPITRLILDFKLNEPKISKAKKHSGFFSIITYGIDFDPIRTFRSYRLRDEQEKYFQQMKGQMIADKQRNWSEEGKTGRLFILFVSLTLSSYLRYIWKSTNLKDKFLSSLDILDEMRSIRCIEHTNRAKIITPFVGAQLEICKAFGFEVPKGCAPLYASRQKPKRKRGRPPKRKAGLSL